MKAPRLVVLLALAALLLVIRLLIPPNAPHYSVAEPVKRARSTAVPSSQSMNAASDVVAVAVAVKSDSSKSDSSAASSPVAASPNTAASSADSAASASTDVVVGNAFSVRAPPPPPVVAPPARPIAPPPPPVMTPPPPPPPLEVIGTYDDGAASAVFVATPTGTVLARTGTVLMSDYRVTAVTANQVSLLQVSTQRALQLTVPSGVGR